MMTPFPPRQFLLFLLACLLFNAGDAVWEETAKIIDQDGEYSDRFGNFLATNNGILAVGAPSDRIGFSPAVSFTIFERVDGEWSTGAKIFVPVDPDEAGPLSRRASDGDGFRFLGRQAATSNGTVAVGAQKLDNGDEVDAGAVYIYGKEDGETWTEQQKLLPSDIAGYYKFGVSLAMQGKALVVGASGGTGTGGTLYTGAAYVYTFSASIWTESAKLTASDGSLNDLFGEALAIDAETIVVGAPYHGVAVPVGSAYVFQDYGGLWTQQAMLTSSDGRDFGEFGIAVAVEGDTVCVGSWNNVDEFFEGAVYVYRREGDVWTQQAKLVASDFEVQGDFGASLVLRDGVLVVGAYGNTGAVYLFTLVESVWTEQAKLVSSDGALGDEFGIAVDFDDGLVIAGASSVGAAYAFEWRASESPSIMPSVGLSIVPTQLSSSIPTGLSSTSSPSTMPSALPSAVASQEPSNMPLSSESSSEQPSSVVSELPTGFTSEQPSDSIDAPSVSPSDPPSVGSSMPPTLVSSSISTTLPSTGRPSTTSSELPSQVASQEPSSTLQPSDWLGEEPSSLASDPPTSSTSEQPSDSSAAPSVSPSDSPGTMPSLSPLTTASSVPTQLPSVNPSSPPPTGRSSTIPSELPSTVASQEPTNTPIPSGSSSEQPSSVASVPPTNSASEQPSESSTEPSGLATESPGATPSLPPRETSEMASNFSLSHTVIETGFVRIIEGSIIDAAELLNNTYTRAGFQVTYDASGFDDVASVRLGIGGNFICFQAAPFERNISADGYTELVSELFAIADCEGTMVHREQVSFNFYECPLGICIEADVEMVWTNLTQYNITNRTGVLCDCVACPFGDSEGCDNDANEESDATTTEATRMGFRYSDPVNRERALLGEHRSGFYERLEAFNGGWNTSRANRTLLFKVQDSDECLERQEGGGRRTASRRLNPAFSGGSGTASIHTERTVYMRLDIQGRAAATVVQNMTVWFDGEPLVEGRGGRSSPNSPGCINTYPRLTYFESSPIRILLDAGSDHVLDVRFESDSGTLGSYFQLVLAFEDIGSAEPTRAPVDSGPQLPTSSPSEIAAPTTAPSQTPKEDPTESPTSVSSTQGPSHMPSPPLSVSPTWGQSMEPTYSPTTVSPTDSDPQLPTSSPSEMDVPTTVPTQPPQDEPTEYPSFSGTQESTRSPSQLPSVLPTHSTSPTDSDPQLPTSSPSEMGAPTTVPTLPPQDEPTEYPSLSYTQESTRSPSQLPRTAPPHSTTISPTGGQSVEPTYSPTDGSSHQLSSVFAPDFSGFAQDGCIMYEIPDNPDDPVDVRSTGRTPRICVAVDFCESEEVARTVCSCTALIPGSVVRTIGRGGHGPRRFGRECGCSVCDDGKGIDVDCGSFGVGCRGAETFLRRLDL